MISSQVVCERLMKSIIMIVEDEEDGAKESAETIEETDDNTKRANHFSYIERASQTKQFDVQENECQTDPPPM